jgi:SAM-dependent methyltransferase
VSPQASVLVPADAAHDVGAALRREIDGLLPADWAWDGKRTLDFGSGLVRASAAGLPLEDASLDLVVATSVFTALADHWPGWLLELHRLLAPGGILIGAFPGEELSRAAVDAPWGEARAGATLTADGESFEVAVYKLLVSPWWTCARWRQAFDILRVEPSGLNGHGVVVARKP